MPLSVFQGTVLISAKSFAKLWPSEEGFRVFLVDAPAGSQAEIARRLGEAFQRSGLDAISAVDRLRMFYSVESTYLRVFLVLGGLGMLLGGTATGVVVLRNVFERRREIALLRAMGFPRDTVFRLLLCEHALLLSMGMVTGGVASAVAMIPALASSGAADTALWRVAVFAAVLAGAGLCVWGALSAALRKVDISALQAE